MTSQPSSRLALVTLPVLVLVSGSCGIAYEVLYARLLGNVLGDRFTIVAMTDLTPLTP